MNFYCTSDKRYPLVEFNLPLFVGKVNLLFSVLLVQYTADQEGIKPLISK